VGDVVCWLLRSADAESRAAARVAISCSAWSRARTRAVRCDSVWATWCTRARSTSARLTGPPPSRAATADSSTANRSSDAPTRSARAGAACGAGSVCARAAAGSRAAGAAATSDTAAGPATWLSAVPGPDAESALPVVDAGRESPVCSVLVDASWGWAAPGPACVDVTCAEVAAETGEVVAVGLWLGDGPDGPTDAGVDPPATAVGAAADTELLAAPDARSGWPAASCSAEDRSGLACD